MIKFNALGLEIDMFNENGLKAVKEALKETLPLVKSWDDYEDLIKANAKIIMLYQLEKLEKEQKKGKKS